MENEYKNEGMRLFEELDEKPIFTMKVAACHYEHYWDSHIGLVYNPDTREKWFAIFVDTAATGRWDDETYPRRVALPANFPDIDPNDLVNFLRNVEPSRTGGSYELQNGALFPRTITSENATMLIKAAKTHLN